MRGDVTETENVLAMERRRMKALTTALLSLLFAGAAFCADNRTDTVTVRGAASTNVAPDTVYITLFAVEQGMIAEQAVTKVDQKASTIKAALLKAYPKISSIEVSDVKLGEKSSRIYRAEEGNEPPRPEAIKRLLITLAYGSTNVSQIVDTALMNGATMQVPTSAAFAGDLGSVVLYGLVAFEKIEVELTGRALADAQHQADVLAKASGKTLGPIVSVTEGDANMAAAYMVYQRGTRPHLATRYVAGSADDLEISRGVQATYQWK